MIEHIYVDIDGVLADYMGRWRDLYPKNHAEDSLSNNKKKALFREQWRQFIEDENFATLDEMPDLDFGLAALEIFRATIPVEILGSTAYPDVHDELVRQKKIWLADHGIPFRPIFVPGKALKKNYAAPNHVLIDDTLINVAQWKEHGGIGIHHKNWRDTIKELRELV